MVIHFVIHYFRYLKDSDTYVVLINLGAREEKLDVSPVHKELPKNFEIVAVNPDSCYAEG